MARGVSADTVGTLYLELVANVQEIVGQMETIKRAVGGASDDMARKTRAVNDNFTTLAGAAMRLREQIDPMAVAQNRFNRQMDEADLLLKTGTITLREHTQAVEMARTALQLHAVKVAGSAAANDRLTATTGQQKAGMQQLGLQLNDVATMYAMGANGAQIFASQAGQVIQAVQLMTGGTSMLAKFLGGPWGMAITTATVVMIPFIAKLFETGNAAEKAAQKVYGLKDALADMRTKPMEALGALNTQVILAEAKLRQAQAMPRFTGGGSDQYKQNTFIERQRAKAIADAQVELANAKSSLAVANATVKTNESLFQISAKAGRLRASSIKDTETHTTASRKHAASVAKQSEKLDELTRIYIELGKAMKDAELAKPPSIDADWQKMWDGWGTQSAQVTAGITASADASAMWNDELRDTINLLDQIGGFGSTLGNIGAVFEAMGSGNWRNVRGPLGAIGGALGSVGWTSMDANGDRTIHLLGDEFRDVLDSVFGTDGSFKKTLQSAGLGVAAGQMVLGSKNSGIGSAVGGVLGEVAGKALTKGMKGVLGAIGGPLGSIVGGVLGGVLGSAFTKVKNGYGIASNTGVTSGGTSAELAASSKTSASGIVGSIQAIADQLGGSVGQYAVSIGKRSSGWIRVSAAGSSRVADKSFSKNAGSDLLYDGKDEAEALRIALLNAIRDGAIQGVRVGTNALLQKDGDIEAQLAKALKFEGVFKSLKQATDPVGYAMEQLTREFDALKKIFDEAGASAAEYADLEKLLNLQKQEALDKAAAEMRQKALEAVNDPLKLQIRILELMGKEQDAVAAARLMELAGLKGSLQPLQAMVYQLEDARAVIEQFGPLAADLRAYRKELLGGQVGNTFAQLTAQFRQTAGMAANGDATAIGQLRGISGQYLDAAKENAASAVDYQRSVSEVLAAVDRGIFAADSQADYAQAQIDAIEHTGQIMQDMKTELATLQKQVADTSATTLKLLQRFEINGVPVNADAGALTVQVVS